MKTGYVDLARRFVQFQEGDSDEAAWLSYYRPADLYNSVDWDELITADTRCAVVLGEAGIGKTWEFEARSEILNAHATESFFLALDDLVDKEIHECFGKQHGDRLKNWLGGAERGVFFVDAVDDARLRDPHALEKALRARSTAVSTEPFNGLASFSLAA
jgi:hypothetical protein